MATIIEGSMPISVEGTANATQHDASGLVESLYSTYSAASNWQIGITALLVLVAYDQCKLRSPCHIQPAPFVSEGADTNRLIHLTEGIHCRAYVQDPPHGTISASHLPQIRRIPRPMGQWPPQLRLCIPQVSLCRFASCLAYCCSPFEDSSS